MRRRPYYRDIRGRARKRLKGGYSLCGKDRDADDELQAAGPGYYNLPCAGRNISESCGAASCWMRNRLASSGQVRGPRNALREAWARANAQGAHSALRGRACRASPARLLERSRLRQAMGGRLVCGRRRSLPKVHNKSRRVPVRAPGLGACPVPAPFLIYNHLLTLGHL